MSRNLPAQTSTNLSADYVQRFSLVQMDLLSGTLRLTTTDFDVPYGGFTWAATYGLGAIETISETGQQVKGVSFSVSGVLSSLISMALTENVYGRPVTIMLATLSGGVISVDPSVWLGNLDTMVVESGGQSAAIRITAENRMVMWQRPHPVNFSDAEQRLVSSTDSFFSRAAKISQQVIVWPGKEALKQ